MRCHHFCNEQLRCPECARRFWKWAEQHTNGRGKRGRGHGTAQTFYEAASVEYPGGCPLNIPRVDRVN